MQHTSKTLGLPCLGDFQKLTVAYLKRRLRRGLAGVCSVDWQGMQTRVVRDRTRENYEPATVLGMEEDSGYMSASCPCPNSLDEGKLISNTPTLARCISLLFFCSLQPQRHWLRPFVTLQWLISQRLLNCSRQLGPLSLLARTQPPHLSPSYKPTGQRKQRSLRQLPAQL